MGVMGNKKCAHCQITKPATEFYKDKSRKDGLNRLCKECTKRDNKKRYKENAQARREHGKKYRQKNKKLLAEKDRLRYLEKRDIKREWNAQYRQANREKMAEYKVAWRINNRERYMELRRKNESARRARRFSSQVEELDLELIQSRVDYYGGKCWICKIGPYEHLDHVKPLSKGGPHMLSNLRPACEPCNISKGNKWPFTPVDLAA